MGNLDLKGAGHCMLHACSPRPSAPVASALGDQSHFHRGIMGSRGGRRRETAILASMVTAYNPRQLQVSSFVVIFKDMANEPPPAGLHNMEKTAEDLARRREKECADSKLAAKCPITVSQADFSSHLHAGGINAKETVNPGKLRDMLQDCSQFRGDNLPAIGLAQSKENSTHVERGWDGDNFDESRGNIYSLHNPLNVRMVFETAFASEGKRAAAPGGAEGETKGTKAEEAIGAATGWCESMAGDPRSVISAVLATALAPVAAASVEAAVREGKEHHEATKQLREGAKDDPQVDAWKDFARTLLASTADGREREALTDYWKNFIMKYELAQAPVDIKYFWARVPQPRETENKSKRMESKVRLQRALSTTNIATELDEDVSRDLGPCTCDLASGLCDAHCCCDPDCSDDLAGSLAQTFDCLPEGLAPANSQFCYSKDWVTNVNPRVDLWVVADDLRSLLCVEVDNNEVQGVFYANSPTVASSTIAQERERQQQSGFGDVLAAAGAAAAQTVMRAYQAGDVLRVHMALSTVDSTIQPFSSLESPGVTQISAGLALRAPGALGGCPEGSAAQLARFLMDVPSTSCWIERNLVDACAVALNPVIATSWKIPTQLLAGTLKCGTSDSGSLCLAPEVSVVDAGGASTELRDPVFSQNGGACSCEGAIRSLQYAFYFDSAAKINKAQVNITLQDIQDAPCEGGRVAQSTSVVFLQGADPSSVTERSGNPGYIVGLPLLVADAIPQRPRAATIDGVSRLGGCLTVGSFRSAWNIALNFGEDTVLGCTLALTRAELEAECCDDASCGFSSKLKILRVLGPPEPNWTHIAAWGSVAADSEDPEDWVEVSFDSVTETPQFSQDATSASQSKCEGAVVGVDLQVLYSPFGDVRNPQNKIVAATAAHRVGELQHTRQDPREKQHFQFTFTVSFTRLDRTEDPAVRAPPRARLPLLLPQHLFYPFRLGSGARPRAGRPRLLAAALLLLAPLAAAPAPGA
ncbi:unnamed protein product [Prorocentrum cordatum]|uniref:Tectonic-1-3 N-terminal domain-containing protein n=1 Tax=Prorocentrum cordatum TaxID=2364126 RepID=A0ABN9PNS4_9DINO|nr:unnamed protein product [Polarella glacialis]